MLVCGLANTKDCVLFITEFDNINLTIRGHTMDEGDGGMPGVAMMPEVVLGDAPVVSGVISPRLAQLLDFPKDVIVSVEPTDKKQLIRGRINELLNSVLCAYMVFGNFWGSLIVGITFEATVAPTGSAGAIFLASLFMGTVGGPLMIMLSSNIVARYQVTSGKYPLKQEPKPVTVGSLIAYHQSILNKLKAPWLADESRFSKIIGALESKVAEWQNRVSRSEDFVNKTESFDPKTRDEWRRLATKGVEEDREKLTSLQTIIVNLKSWRQQMLTAIDESMPELGELETKIQLLQHEEARVALTAETRNLLEHMATVVADESRATRGRISLLGGKVEAMESVVGMLADFTPGKLLADAEMYTTMSALEGQLATNDIMVHE